MSERTIDYNKENLLQEEVENSRQEWVWTSDLISGGAGVGLGDL